MSKHFSKLFYVNFFDEDEIASFSALGKSM